MKTTSFVADYQTRKNSLVEAFLGRLMGAYYGFRMAGLKGFKTGWSQLVIHPGSFFRVEPGAELLLRGQLRIGLAWQKGGLPLPGLQHTGISIRRDAVFSCGADVSLAKGAHVHVSKGAVAVIGDRTFVGYNSSVYATHKIVIGSDCAISWGVNILDSYLHKLEGDLGTSPIVIGSRVWIGHNVTILPGVRIGDGAVIGANSVVTKDVPEKTLCVGVPAKVIRKDVSWQL